MAVLSLRFQRIHLYQLRKAGILTPLMVIGARGGAVLEPYAANPPTNYHYPPPPPLPGDYCFSDDGMFLSQSGATGSAAGRERGAHEGGEWEFSALL